MDNCIQMSLRVLFLEACVRSRLLYSMQSCELSGTELLKIESVWHRFLRKVVRNGFKREKKCPDTHQEGH